MDIVIDKIIKLTKKKMEESGEYSREVFHQFVDEAIEYYMSKGEITDDDNIKFIEDRVYEMYDTIKDSLGDDDIIESNF